MIQRVWEKVLVLKQVWKRLKGSKHVETFPTSDGQEPYEPFLASDSSGKDDSFSEGTVD